MYFRRSLIQKCVVKTDIIKRICNHRKRYHEEGELLALWNNGERTWGPITDIKTDLKLSKITPANDIGAYLRSKRLTLKDMGMGLLKKK